MEHRPIEWKSVRAPVDWAPQREGEFAARFSTFGVVDADGDVTLPDAFTDGQPVIIGAWGHDRKRLPAGRGTVRVRNDGAYVEGAFFLETEAGRETYATVKGLGDLQQWSYLYIPTEVSYEMRDGREVRILRKVQLISVDPVDIGAGVGTATVAIKGRTLAEDVCGAADEALRVARRLAERAAVRGADGRGLGAAAEAAAKAAADLRAAADEIERALRASGQVGAKFSALAAGASARAAIARAILASKEFEHAVRH